MFIHWDNCNRIHKGNNFINIRRTHTVLCTPLLPRTPMAWLGTCSFSRSEQLRRPDWKHYPLKILGFLSIEGKRGAVIQCSIKPLLWSTVESFFFVKIELGMDFNISFVTVPIEALVHPLCLIPDCGGDSNIYFVILPKHNWSQFFGEIIIITTHI